MIISEQPKMDAQTRFAKMFKLTSENGKMWILIFVERKIGVGMQCRDLKTYIKAEHIDSKDTTGSIQRALRKMSKSSDLDITALNVIVNRGEILKSTEKASTGLVKNTVGDLIVRLRHLRNDIVHSGEASLELDEYNCHLDELRYIAKYFERVNGVAQDTYKNEIDYIDRKIWADKEVQDEIQLFKTYLENILQSAIFQQGNMSIMNILHNHVAIYICFTTLQTKYLSKITNLKIMVTVRRQYLKNSIFG